MSKTNRPRQREEPNKNYIKSLKKIENQAKESNNEFEKAMATSNEIRALLEGKSQARPLLTATQSQSTSQPHIQIGNEQPTMVTDSSVPQHQSYIRQSNVAAIVNARHLHNPLLAQNSLPTISVQQFDGDHASTPTRCRTMKTRDTSPKIRAHPYERGNDNRSVSPLMRHRPLEKVNSASSTMMLRAIGVQRALSNNDVLTNADMSVANSIIDNSLLNPDLGVAQKRGRRNTDAQYYAPSMVQHPLQYASSDASSTCHSQASSNLSIQNQSVPGTEWSTIRKQSHYSSSTSIHNDTYSQGSPSVESENPFSPNNYEQPAFEHQLSSCSVDSPQFGDNFQEMSLSSNYSHQANETEEADRIIDSILQKAHDQTNTSALPQSPNSIARRNYFAHYRSVTIKQQAKKPMLNRDDTLTDENVCTPLDLSNKFEDI